MLLRQRGTPYSCYQGKPLAAEDSDRQEWKPYHCRLSARCVGKVGIILRSLRFEELNDIIPTQAKGDAASCEA